MKTTDMNIVQTNGQIFPDGAVIELMRTATNQTVLLFWSDEHFEMADRMEYSGSTYAAPQIAPSILRALRLPSQIGPPETTETLFSDLHAFFTSHSGQFDSCVIPLVFAVFASWLSPVLPIDRSFQSSRLRGVPRPAFCSSFAWYAAARSALWG